MVKWWEKIISVTFIMKVKIKKSLVHLFNQSEASKISPEWNSWLRFISKTSPQVITLTYQWQKRYYGNVTGLDIAYKPGNQKNSRKRFGELSI